MAGMIVQAIWLRGPMTELAQMSLASYLAHGYQVCLWTYGTEETFPDDVIVLNAHQLMPWSEVEAGRFAPSGQMALACDRLAWIASQSHGGWMVHLDVTLLKPLPEGQYVFGPHHRHPPSLALWKAPWFSPLMHRALKVETPLPHTDWHAMMKVMSATVRDCDLQGYIRPDLVNDDGDEQPILDLLKAGSELPPAWRDLTAIHWMGSGRIRGATPEPGSYYERLRESLGVEKQ